MNNLSVPCYTFYVFKTLHTVDLCGHNFYCTRFCTMANGDVKADIVFGSLSHLNNIIQLPSTV